MKHVYIFEFYSVKPRPKTISHYRIVVGEQPMLDEVVEATKKKLKFAVYALGRCISDYSK
jgi:hypothetical protein